MVKILHTADWQLGKPFARFSDEARAALFEARLDVIDTIAAVARDQAAAHIIVAGDVFDNLDPGDRLLVQSLTRMSGASVTWWLMPGNHDHVHGDGLWSRVRGKAPPNVRILAAAEPVELEEGAWLLPAPLEHRRTRSDPTEIFTSMSTPSGAARIGLAHGSIKDFGGSSPSNNLIPPDRAKTAGLDYLALGDWHGHLVVNDRTAYSGTPEPDSFGHEDAASVIIAECASGTAPQLSRITTGRFRWLTQMWELADQEDFAREAAGLRNMHDMPRTLVDLRLTGAVSLADRVTILAKAKDLAHELRWLDLRDEALTAKPTEDDIADIDVQGILGQAAASLLEKTMARDSDAALASAALERLYIEAIRAQREADA